MNTLNGSFCLHKKTPGGSPAKQRGGGGLGAGRSSPLLQNTGEDLTANLLIGCFSIALALQKERGLMWRRNLPICKNMDEVQNQ